LLANGWDPLAVFDIDGQLQFFLRAYITINLLFTSFTETFEFARVTLFKFHVDFKRPSFLGTQNGGALTLAIGPNSKNRLQGNLDDIAETIHVESNGGAGSVRVWSDQFNRSESNGQDFSGITSIIANGGPGGDDYIDLKKLSDPTISVVVHGGGGNSTIIGPAASKCDDKGICAQLFGDSGNVHITSSSSDQDLLDGGKGTDSTLDGGASKSILRNAAHMIASSGAVTFDPGHGNGNIEGGTGKVTYVGKDAGSVVEITTLDNGGAGTLDMSKRTENVTFIAKEGKLLVGWGPQGTTSSNFITGVNDFLHMIEVDHIGSIGTIKGGSGADEFDIWQTGAGFPTRPTLLDGQGGNDTYKFLDFGSGAYINTEVNDTGNPWDSENRLVVSGSTGSNTMLVTNDHICATNCATDSQRIKYDAPGAGGTVLRLVVQGNSGNDHFTVQSTSPTVPVRVELGGGNNVINVGAGMLSGIQGISRAGLDTPFGLGPLVVVGGSGTNLLVVDD